MCRQVVHLQCLGTTINTSISSVQCARKWAQVRSTDITVVIQEIVRAAGPAIRFTADDISARSLCDGGAMALLIDKADKDTICLVGGCWSNTMIYYLHTIAKSVTAGLDVCMLQHSDYALIPPMHTGF